MQRLEGVNGLRQVPPRSVLSVGNFDGVHRGHQRLLQVARQLRDSGQGASLVVVTFEPHPLTVLRPEKAPPRLTPPGLKHALLEQQQVDYLVELPPGREVLDLTAEEFWRILRDEVQVAHLVEGPDFNFGKGRGGTIERLRQWSAASDVRLDVLEPVTAALVDLQVVAVNSSLIRWLVSAGRVRDAAICLGRPYILEGEIVRGYERGRTIGMPTANLQCGDQLVPLDGVYIGRTEVDGQRYPAAVSIGTMPTFGENRRQIEAHLIGFSGDLYGHVMRLELVEWLRDQRKFQGIDQLKAQLARDIAAVTARWTQDPSRPIAGVV